MNTELDAVNAVLMVIGNAQTQTLNDGDIDTISARAFLSRAKSGILKHGWYFNRATLELAANTAGEEIIPSDALKVESAGGYIPRGRRLWDSADNTYNIGEAVSVTYIQDTKWDDLPFSAYEAAVSLASYRALRDMDGDTDRTRELYGEYEAAMQTVRAEDVAFNGYNLFNSPKISAAMQRIRPAAGYHSAT